MLTRREFAQAGGIVLAGLVGGPIVWRFRQTKPTGGTVEISMRSNTAGSEVWFDPIGIQIEPGQTVRWVVEQHAHTTTAYHPMNGGRQRRIPDLAAPWDSGYLLKPGDTFEVELSAVGVYDYFCAPHEAAGMVGRIVVGNPDVSSVLDFNDTVPIAARAAFPAADDILRHGVIRR